MKRELRALRPAWRFHREHSVMLVGHNARVALDYARAELEMLDRSDLRYRWEYEDDPDASWMDQKQREEYENGDTQFLCCFLEKRCGECGGWKVVASLGGIHVYTSGRQRDDYIRTVEAELASEYLHEERAA